MHKHKQIYLVFILFIFLLTSCRSSAPTVNMKTESLRNGRVVMYHTYDKASEQMIYWEQHSVIREVYGKAEYRIEHVGVANQEFRQCFLQDEPCTVESYLVYRIETPAEENKENQEQKVAIDKTLTYKGIRKGKSFYSYNKTITPDTIKRVYIAGQCFELEALPYLLCMFPFEESESLSIPWVKTRMPRQLESTDSMKGTTSVRVEKKEEIQVKGKQYETFQVSIPILNCTAWYMVSVPHVLVKIEYPDRVEVINQWNEI